MVTRRGQRTGMLGRPAPAIVGLSPTGDPVEIPTAGRRVLFAFLTSSCQPCQALWRALAGAPDEAPLELPPGAPAVAIVTPSPSTESRRKVAELAPGAVPVVMASEGWHSYGVTGASWMVLVDDGVVVAEAPAHGPDDLRRLLAPQSG